jgi:hypothetical protein
VLPPLLRFAGQDYGVHKLRNSNGRQPSRRCYRDDVQRWL